MVKYTNCLIIALAAFLFACSGEKPSEEANALFAEKGIDSTQAAMIFNNTVDFPNNTHVSIALVTDSTTYFIGIVSRNDTILSVANQDAHFEIGSISTMMTAALLADFIEGGKVSINDSISKFLPFQFKDSLEISFGQLANHTSGLPKVPTGMLISSLLNMDNPYKNFDDSTLVNYFREDVELSTEPGESISFSNLGYGLLGYTMEKVGEKSFGVLLNEQILDKYKLNNTTIERDSVINSLIPGLNADGNKTSNWDMAALAGAGAVISTAEDLALFARAHCDTTDMVLTLTREVEVVGQNKKFVGMGWTLIDDKGENRWYAQNGSTGGYTSSFIVDPLSCKGVVILSNVSGSNPYTKRIEELCLQLMGSLQK